MKTKSAILFPVWFCLLIISAQICDFDALLVRETAVRNDVENLVADQGTHDTDCQCTILNELSENADSEAIIPKKKRVKFHSKCTGKRMLLEQKSQCVSRGISHFYTNLPPPVV